MSLFPSKKPVKEVLPKVLFKFCCSGLVMVFLYLTSVVATSEHHELHKNTVLRNLLPVRPNSGEWVRNGDSRVTVVFAPVLGASSVSFTDERLVSGVWMATARGTWSRSSSGCSEVLEKTSNYSPDHGLLGFVRFYSTNDTYCGLLDLLSRMIWTDDSGAYFFGPYSVGPGDLGGRFVHTPWVIRSLKIDLLSESDRLIVLFKDQNGGDLQRVTLVF